MANSIWRSSSPAKGLIFINGEWLDRVLKQYTIIYKKSAHSCMRKKFFENFLIFRTS